MRNFKYTQYLTAIRGNEAVLNEIVGNLLDASVVKGGIPGFKMVLSDDHPIPDELLFLSDFHHCALTMIVFDIEECMKKVSTGRLWKADDGRYVSYGVPFHTQFDRDVRDMAEAACDEDDTWFL